MNGAQDLGGMMGFGPIVPETDEPWFHAEWERRAFGVTLAMGFTGTWNLDMTRHARESLPPAEYLAASYYEIWIKGLERLVVETGLVTPEELATGRALTEPAPLRRVLKSVDVPAVLAGGGPADRPPEQPARFAVGDRVITRNMHPKGHTRLPRYARDKLGTVELIHGCHAYPDSVATDRGDDPQWLYTVVFDGQEIWGPDTDPTLTISIDAFEPYLEPA